MSIVLFTLETVLSQQPWVVVGAWVVVGGWVVGGGVRLSSTTVYLLPWMFNTHN